MSAQELREAAALMRSRAEVIVPSPGHDIATDWRDWHRPVNSMGEEDHHEAQHIASWHPAVALAVADWLEATADRIDAGRDPKNGGRRNHGWRGSREALTVARAYLGGDQ